MSSLVDELIGDMEYEDALTYLTTRWADHIFELLNNPEIPLEIRENTMMNILEILKGAGIQDISYNLVNK